MGLRHVTAAPLGQLVLRRLVTPSGSVHMALRSVPDP